MVFRSRAGWAKAWRPGSQQLSEAEGRGEGARRAAGTSWKALTGSWGLRFHPEEPRRARKGCRIQGETDLP